MIHGSTPHRVAKLHSHLLEIRNLYVAIAVYDPLKENIGAIWSANLLGHLLRITVDRNLAERSTIEKSQSAAGGAAESMGLFEDCVEYRGQIAGGGVDDLQYLGGRSLLLQCLARLCDQPCILDRNDRLIRKGAYQ